MQGPSSTLRSPDDRVRDQPVWPSQDDGRRECIGQRYCAHGLQVRGDHGRPTIPVQDHHRISADRDGLGRILKLTRPLPSATDTMHTAAVRLEHEHADLGAYGPVPAHAIESYRRRLTCQTPGTFNRPKGGERIDRDLA